MRQKKHTDSRRCPFIRRERSKTRHRPWRLLFERLESRQLLASDLNFGEWFRTFDDVERMSPAELARNNPLPDSFIGPRALEASEWIVQLTDDAIADLVSLESVDELLDVGRVDFTVVSGLGQPGTVLLRAESSTIEQASQVLSNSANVYAFFANDAIQGQATPNDDDFVAGLQSNFRRINLPEVWDVTTGDPSVVVGVVDSGIDATHRDLYLNLWLNQGEIPVELREHLVDIDGDGLITFYDLNNLRVDERGVFLVASTGATADESQLRTTPFDLGDNAAFVTDMNANGRIDAVDLLDDVTWADGRDTDANGFFDDFFGVNFRSGNGDPFPRNRPLDELGHGTHVAGTIGAIGNNDFGVAGVAWQTSLMSLRILDNNNQSDAASAISAINYASMMRSRWTAASDATQGANVRVLNNSWGQTGGFESLFELTIENASQEGILFVAAVGNGNLFGDGVDNDRVPFYPANYENSNVISVAAFSESANQLATFSNYGDDTVDIAAPGTSVLSTFRGDAIGVSSGTSMATPHVSGAAALAFAALPNASLDEVKTAILSSASAPNGTALPLASGGVLDVSGVINAPIFAPVARLVASEDITEPGGDSARLTVEYSHRDGINVASLGDDDLVVSRRWGPQRSLPTELISDSIVSSDGTVTATYRLDAPGGESYLGAPVSLGVKRFESAAESEITMFRPNTVTKEILISGAPDEIEAMAVTVGLTHTWSSDLTATLVSPSGRRAVLFSGIGNADDDFAPTTTFRDDAAVSINDAVMPFTGTFRPTESLAGLLDADPNGVWTLEVVDDFRFDGGGLTEFSLEIPYASSEVLVKDVSSLRSEFNVQLDVDTTSVNTLSAAVVSQAGQRIRLFSDLDVSGQDELRVAFSDEATEMITVPTGPLEGTFLPEQSLSELAASNPNGVWRLELQYDEPATGNANWSLDFRGAWDAVDFGVYEISSIDGAVSSNNGLSTTMRPVGQFDVRISDPSIIYVDSLEDSVEGNSLRSAIMQANARGTDPTTIILGQGTHTLDIPPDRTDANDFVDSDLSMTCDVEEHELGWSDATTGDLLISGNVTIVGSSAQTTKIRSTGLDRIFRVQPQGSLSLVHVEVSGGVSSDGHGGGAILSAGNLLVNDTVLSANRATGDGLDSPQRGGAISVWDGHASITSSVMKENRSDFGAAVFFCGVAGGNVIHSSVNDNVGGGLHSHSDSDLFVRNSTFSNNQGGLGAIFNGKRDGRDTLFNQVFSLDHAAISGNGQYVAYQTLSDNVVPGDTNLQEDVFLLDRASGITQRVSTNADGVEGDLLSSFPTISDDGRFVAFESFATNLVSDDTNDAADIFLFDRDATNREERIRRISVADDGTEADSASFNAPSISGNGRFVAFRSSATNLVDDDNNDQIDIFVRDLLENTTRRISVASDGTEANGGSDQPSITEDGRFIAFVSDADNLVPEDDNLATDVFVYDTQSGTIERVNVSDDGSEASRFSVSSRPAISDDGDLIVFASDADNLVPDDSNGVQDVFLYHRQTQSITRLSESSGGEVGNSISEAPALSGDGRFVAFESVSTNLVPGDENSAIDIFLRDLQAGTIEVVSRSGFDVATNGNSRAPLISDDGNVIVYESAASNIVQGDAVGNSLNTADLFLFDRESQETNALTFVATPSTINVLQSTIVNTSDARFTTQGAVRLVDTLLADEIAVDGGRTRQINTIQSLEPNASEFQPLESLADLPPVHLLRASNPAIDAGQPWLEGTVDQSGIPRGTSPDIGASEAFFGDVSGNIYLDRDRGLTRGADEPGVPGILIRLNSLTTDNSSLSQMTISDEPLTSAINEAGDFVFAKVPSGDYQIEVVAPNSFSFSTTDLRIPIADLPARPPSLSENGELITFDSVSGNLVSSDQNLGTDQFVFNRLSGAIERVSVDSDGNEADPGPDVFRFGGVISGNGRFVAFQSGAELVPEDTNLVEDIYVRDLVTKTTERVNVNDDGEEAAFFTQSFNVARSLAPSINDDGNFITYTSNADNLVAGDTNEKRDIFVFDRTARKVERITRGFDGSEADGHSDYPTISADGNVVAFISEATNLVEGDNNEVPDVFVYDRISDLMERVSVNDSGDEGDAGSGRGSVSLSLTAVLSLSEDGRFVAFASDASNLVPDDTNALRDIFVFDRDNKTMERVSAPADGVQANSFSDFPVLSGDGRFVVFQSAASNLVENDTNEEVDVFVVDRVESKLARVSTSPGGEQGNESSRLPSVSGSGRFIGFYSSADNLVPGDLNGDTDLFVVNNPLIEPGSFLNIQPASNLSEFSLGLVPDPGQIRGTVFEDVVENQLPDDGERRFENWTVYLDQNGNRVFDVGEPSAQTDANGEYLFDNLESFRDYAVRVVVESGWEQNAPSVNAQQQHAVFLPAGGQIDQRDFGVIRSTIVGQAVDSSVSGRVFFDNNGNGVFDDGDTGAANTTVYADRQNPNGREENEPVVTTNGEGIYRIEELGSGIVSVTTELPATVVQAAPLGASFEQASFLLRENNSSDPGVKSVVIDDFNGDGHPDVAVSQFNRDLLSIHFNDGMGGLIPSPLDIPVGQAGPNRLVVGQFNEATSLPDIAVANLEDSTITILRDYGDGEFTILPPISVGANVGDEPIDLVVVDDEGTGEFQDIVVLNRNIPSNFGLPGVSITGSLQRIYNNGNFSDEGFTVGDSVATAGLFPFSLTAGRFDSDDMMDVAVVHSTGAAVGNVQVFIADVEGRFESLDSYSVGRGPTQVVAGDFDHDPGSQLDLAVINEIDSTISLLVGNDDGSFTVLSDDKTVGTSPSASGLQVGDIDSDGDLDLLTSDLVSRSVTIFINNTASPGDPAFAPGDSFGVAQIPVQSTFPLALADIEGTGGTLDVVSVIRVEGNNEIVIAKNRLAAGSFRVALDGTNDVTGLDFIVEPAILAPQLDPIPAVPPIVEDSGPQAVTLTGVAKGRETGPELQFEVESSAPLLIAPEEVLIDRHGDSATLTFSPRPNANGQATVTVRVVDAGHDETLGTHDDGILIRSFIVDVLPVNDPPIFEFGTALLEVNQRRPQAVELINRGPGGGADEVDQALGSFAVSVPDEDIHFFAPDELPRILDDQIVFTPILESTGTARISVTLQDEGGTSNGGIDTTTETLLVNFGSPSLIVEGEGNRIDVSTLQNLEMVDLRGSGSNTIVIDRSRLESAFTESDLRVIVDSDDRIESSEPGWELLTVIGLGADQEEMRFQSGFAIVQLFTPPRKTNPFNAFDVNGDGHVTAIDALLIVNHLSGINTRDSIFLDVSGDGETTVLDALRVINELAMRRQS